MQVRDLMNPSVICVTTADSTALAARLLSRHNVGALPVCSQDGRLRGILTDRDIVLRCVAEEGDTRQRKVEDVMSRSVVTTEPFAPVAKAAEMMSRDQIRRLPVLENGRLCGMVSLGDLARREQTAYDATDALSEISSNLSSRD